MSRKNKGKLIYYQTNNLVGVQFMSFIEVCECVISVFPNMAAVVGYKVININDSY